MRERIFIIILVYAAALTYDALNRKSESPTAPRDRIVYAILLIGSVYFSLDFIINRNWPDTEDFVPGFIKELAKRIDSFLNVKM